MPTRGHAGLTALFLVFCCNAQAHDVWAVGNPKLEKEAQFNVEDLKKLIALQGGADVAAKRYVLERATLWMPGQKLRGCFLGGDQTQRAAVVSSVKDLLDGKGINIEINFANGADTVCPAGPDGLYPEEMRVSLQDGCCSAYVGRTSLNPAVAAGPNIFLQGPPDDPTIKHEFIHALGFHHEHQKPNNPCKFNYTAIEQAYGWSEQMVKQNFDQLDANSTKFVWSNDFDQDSIMKYWFAPEFLVDGTSSPCYSPQSTTLSNEDWLGLKTAYPLAFDFAAHRAMASKKGSVDFGSTTAPPALKELLASLP
jgi:Astacin (Peptidase family M12A)